MLRRTWSLQRPINPKMLTRLRTFWGTFTKAECTFAGSPAAPVGASHDVRYESLDFMYAGTNTSDNGNIKNQKRLHRIHHIGGFISSLYVAEYRNAATHETSLFLLDSGFPSDLTRVETAMRHVLHCHVTPATGAPDFVAQRMKLVFSTHAHLDHSGGGEFWAGRGVPVRRTKGQELHHVGAGGFLQYFVEAFGANYYAWHLMRTVPEFPWANPHSKKWLAHEAVGACETLRGAGFPDWVVIQIPGHTTHMSMLYHPMTRTAYVADLFLFQFRKYRPPIPVERPDCYAQSLDMVKELPVEWLLMPHGGITRLKCDEDDDVVVVDGGAAADAAADATAADSTKNKKLDEMQTLLTFREICETVKQRAAKASTPEAEAEAKKYVVVRAARWFAKSSPAWKSFDWARDMPLPEKQLAFVRGQIDAVKAQRAAWQPQGELVDNYSAEARPRD